MSSRTGEVKFYNTTKAYGFIIDDATKQELFVHISGCNGPINKGDKVSFDVKEGKKGENAVNVSRL